MAKDSDAKFKILSSALRLQNFTANELATHAGVNPQTAKDFLKSDLFDGVADHQAKVGRPAHRYHLNVAGRDLAVTRLGELQKHLQPSTWGRDDPQALTLLDAASRAIEKGIQDEKERRTALRRMPLLIMGAEAALRDREAAGAPETYAYALTARINRAQTVFLKERIRWILQSPAPEVSEERDELQEVLLELRKLSTRLRDSWLESLRRYVEKFGAWVGNPSTQPVAFVFDAIQGADALTARVMASYARNNVCVAKFDMASMSLDWRKDLYAGLDYLLLNGPTTSAQLALTIDGSQADATVVAREFTTFGSRGEGAQPRHATEPPSGVPRIEPVPAEEILQIRRRFQKMSATARGSMSGPDLFEVALIASAIDWDGSQTGLSGDDDASSVVCFDTTANVDIRSMMAGSHARYVAYAVGKDIDAKKFGLFVQ